MDRKVLYDFWFGERNDFYNSPKGRILLKSQFNPIKEKLYDWKDDNGYSLDIIFLLSGRERAKSFRVTADCLADAYYSNGEIGFAYVRRFAEENKDYMVEDYFTAHLKFVELMTDGKYNSIICNRTSIYLSNSEDESIKKLKVGRTFSINKQAAAKSRQFPNIYNLIFEEVLTDSRYTLDECRNVHNLISTICRGKEHKCRCWLIANTISRINPYVDYFSLDDFNRMKPGQKYYYKFYRDTFEILDDGTKQELYFNICVFYLEDETSEDTKEKSNHVKSIESNKWQEKHSYPHCNLSLCKRFIIDDIPPVVFSYKNGLFMGNIIKLPYEWVQSDFDIDLLDEMSENDFSQLKEKDYRHYVYIQRKTSDIKRGTRLYTNDKKQLLLDMASGLKQLYKIDKIYLILLDEHKVIFSDNLTGNEFTLVYDSLRITAFD